MHWVTIDARHAVQYENAFGMPFFDQVHGYPVLSVEDGVHTDNDISRPGTFMYLKTGGSWPKLSHCMCFGSDIGYDFLDTTRATMVNCGFDEQSGNTVNANKIAIRARGATNAVGVIGGTFDAHAKFMTVNVTGTSSEIFVIGAGSNSGIAVNHIEILSRIKLTLMGSRLNGGTSGVRVSIDDAVQVSAVGNILTGLTNGFINSAAGYITNRLFEDNNIFNGVTTEFANHGSAGIPTIASAGTIVIPSGQGDIFSLTGTTNVGTISASGGPMRPKRHLYFVVPSGLTFLQSATIKLKSGANTAYVAGSIAHFVSDGAAFYEV